MQARCLANFVGENVSCTIGAIVNIDNQEQMDDLVKSGYVEAVNSTTPEAPTPRRGTRKSDSE
jgi:hypothetical protein